MKQEKRGKKRKNTFHYATFTVPTNFKDKAFI